eukprot:57058-Prymnesium_polylepis.1
MPECLAVDPSMMTSWSNAEVEFASGGLEKCPAAPAQNEEAQLSKIDELNRLDHLSPSMDMEDAAGESVDSGPAKLGFGIASRTVRGRTFERVGTAEDGAPTKSRTSCWLRLACVIVTSGLVLTVAGYVAMTHIGAGAD